MKHNNSIEAPLNRRLVAGRSLRSSRPETGGQGSGVSVAAARSLRSNTSIKRAILIGALLLLLASVAALTRWTGIAEGVVRPSAAPLSSQGEGDTEPRQSIRVWLHGDSLYPDLILARPGKIFLRAENQTQSDVTLVLERVVAGQAPQELSRVSTLRKGKRAGQEMALSEGEYIFYEESNPKLQGRLIIEPR